MTSAIEPLMVHEVCAAYQIERSDLSHAEAGAALGRSKQQFCVGNCETLDRLSAHANFLQSNTCSRS
jgi:hypothetical protein